MGCTTDEEQGYQQANYNQDCIFFHDAKRETEVITDVLASINQRLMSLSFGDPEWL